MTLEFTKMQGLGNDFVVIDATKTPVPMDAATAQRIADRHFGIGCDQILLVKPAPRPDVDFGYQIFNADGSEVAQCGNGARCIARFVYEKGLSAKKTIVVATANSTLTLERQANNQVTVSLGVPEIASIERQLMIPDGTSLTITTLAVGNPHAVLTVDDAETAPVESLGPLIERHRDFPERINVGFMQVINREEIRLRVFERGAGETLACGSGACSAVVAGQLQGLLGNQVKTSLNGGEAVIDWAGKGEPVYLTGPAEFVFQGTIQF